MPCRFLINVITWIRKLFLVFRVLETCLLLPVWCFIDTVISWLNGFELVEHDELKRINRRWLFQGGSKIDDNKISPLLAQNLISCRRWDEEILIVKLMETDLERMWKKDLQGHYFVHEESYWTSYIFVDMLWATMPSDISWSILWGDMDIMGEGTIYSWWMKCKLPMSSIMRGYRRSLYHLFLSSLHLPSLYFSPFLPPIYYGRVCLTPLKSKAEIHLVGHKAYEEPHIAPWFSGGDMAVNTWLASHETIIHVSTRSTTSRWNACIKFNTRFNGMSVNLFLWRFCETLPRWSHF